MREFENLVVFKQGCALLRLPPAFHYSNQRRHCTNIEYFVLTLISSKIGRLSKQLYNIFYGCWFCTFLLVSSCACLDECQVIMWLTVLAEVTVYFNMSVILFVLLSHFSFESVVKTSVIYLPQCCGSLLLFPRLRNWLKQVFECCSTDLSLLFVSPAQVFSRPFHFESYIVWMSRSTKPD